ncbi:hypothetical protein ES705_39476 [subsurface metagenome]
MLFIFQFSCRIQARDVSKPEFSVGINTSVNSVLRDSPPITVMANGAPIVLTYSACPIASGAIATIVVIAVINIGRTLARPAVINALERL